VKRLGSASTQTHAVRHAPTTIRSSPFQSYSVSLMLHQFWGQTGKRRSSALHNHEYGVSVLGKLAYRLVTYDFNHFDLQSNVTSDDLCYRSIHSVPWPGCGRRIVDLTSYLVVDERKLGTWAVGIRGFDYCKPFAFRIICASLTAQGNPSLCSTR
jgi:hypothetical protein